MGNQRPVFNFNSAQTLSNRNFTLSEWYHIAVTTDGINHRIYMNGNRTGENNFTLLATREVRLSNYIGRSNVNFDDPLLDAVVDDMKIFNRALNQTEILNDMLLKCV